MQDGRRTGIVRVVDDFGRIVIPMEVRRVLNLDPNVKTEYFCDDERKAIMVYKYPEEECLFCSGKQQIIYFKKFYVCSPCIQSLPTLQVYIEGIERERANETNKEKITSRRKETLDRLRQAIKENPSASQKELAKILGFSEAWVSKLFRNQL
ncbi:transcriptional pleiotropic regulator of transition state genes [Paenibacillus tianmuensis]|uniref:Transcriptional pleiotropic regulator of transition state genes n=1 Tax=Paenibacillus tianmuensis TaxID=624147 RepID=A0A1G4R6G4_9BACL|nr:AbrB/MazE/SpoVT family DNA-binding domain-containing protein [Paenibacillus tianmuensis]SCW52434.1 transcriptional pleiotropic regulator of transition state genes [Paenibacillus tianmuensis]